MEDTGNESGYVSYRELNTSRPSVEKFKVRAGKYHSSSA